MVTQQRSRRAPSSPPEPASAAPRARTAKAALRREQLLATALDLFCTHGYAATSTKRIADAAGVAEGLVFHYFGTKEALLLELATRQDTFAGRVLAIAQSATARSARDVLFAIAAGFGEVTEREAAFIAFMNAEAQVNPVLRAPIAAGTKAVLSALVELLEARQAAGEVRDGALLDVALLGFFGGFSFFFAQNRDVARGAWQREAEAFAGAWAEHCWRGIASDHALSEHSTKGKKR